MAQRANKKKIPLQVFSVRLIFLPISIFALFLFSCATEARLPVLDDRDTSAKHTISERDLSVRAEELFNEGRFEEALEIVHTLEREIPHASLNTELLFLQARIALVQQKRYKARYYLKKILAGRPVNYIHAESLILLGNLFYQDRNYLKASQCYLEALNRQGGEPGQVQEQRIAVIWLRLAEISLYVRRDYELARHQLRHLDNRSLSNTDLELLDRIRKRLRWQEMSPEILGLNDGNISALALDGDDLWIGTWNGGIARYSRSNRKATLFREGKDSLVASTVRCIEITDRRVWVGTYQGLYVYSKATSSWREVEHFSGRGAAGYGADPDRIQALKAVGGDIFVGTLGRGLWRYSEKHWEPVSTGGLPGRFINCLGLSGSHLFIGTMNRGLVIMDLDSGQMHSFDAINGELEARNITLILPDEPDIWIGTYGNGLYRWSVDTGRLSQFTRESGKISDNWILCGLRAESGLYFGTFGGGVSFFPAGGGEWQSIGLRQGLTSLDINSCSYTPPYIYFGTLGCGVAVYYEDED